MAISLPPLPYADTALDPHISDRTISFHYGKHHAAYVNNLNGLIEGTDLADASLDQIIAAAGPGGLYNNAAQVWNHTFYWNSMHPNGGGDPSGDLAAAIDASFGSVDAFKQQFAADSIGNFGSGWTWLVREDDGLAIVKTDDADTPIKHGQIPLLTIDVWEHAYYLDYQNARPAYVETFIEKLLNWEFAAANFAASASA
ncbi:MAG: superoxide dismutase [Fe] [Actinobacteria bacterium]|nr:superoxide dismutase [Fe] [Actinomycetota bacterium]NCG38151.1 superoxide dismutase [Fe] [Actinomycetota bacterium]